MDNSFWLGLLLAVPIGLLTNLATPFVQKYLARRSIKAREARDRQIEQNQRIAQDLAKSPIAYSGYLHSSLVKLLVYVVLILTLGWLPFYVDTEGAYMALRNIVFGREVITYIPVISIISVTGLVIAFSTEVRNSRRLISHVHGISVGDLAPTDEAEI